MYPIKEVFQQGKPQYAPAVMFYPSDVVTEQEMIFQLEVIKKSGINEFYIHPMNGFRGDYLDSSYFDMIRYMVKAAARLDMSYWIYDEYNWPSGSAGGYLIKDKPWTRMTALCMLKRDVAAGGQVSEELPAKANGNTGILAACLVNGNQRTWIDVVYNDDKIIWKNNTKETQTLMVFFTLWSAGVFASARWAEFSWRQEGYLDTLDQEAVQEFINYTHERYKTAVGEYFGSVVKGVFTDEVAAMMPVAPIPGISMLAWSRKFETSFYEQNGYDVKSILPELFIDSKDVKTAKARFDYWNTVIKMYQDAYMRQTDGWCRANNLIYTGHGGGEESLRFQLSSFTDLFEMFKYFEMPGIDSIYSYQRIGDYDFNITAKLASSAARFLGKKRILCETYTGSGWDLTLRQMKRIANRLFLLGINYIQFMGAYYSLNGFRKSGPGGYPPSHNWHNTLFKHYDLFNQYASAMSWLVAETDTCARALLLNPYATARSLAGGPTLREGGEHMGPLGTHPLKDQDLTIQGVVNALLDLHVPFEMAFEQVLDTAEVVDGYIKMCGSCYDVLILPAATYITKGTAKVIHAFARQGGRLILVNGLPQTVIDTLEPTGIESLLTLESVRKIENEPYDLIGHNDKAKAGPFTAALRGSLQGIRPYIADIAYEDGILSVIRQAGDDYYLIIVNDSEKMKTVRGQILLDRPVCVLDPDTGHEKPAKLTKDDHHTDFEIELDGFEATIIIISEESFTMPDFSDSRPETVVIDGDFTLHPCSKNWLLPAARIVSDDGLVSCANQLWQYAAEYKGWQVPAGVQCPKGQVTAVYDFMIQSKPASVALVSESEYPVHWFVNGLPVTEFQTERIWNQANLVAEIGSLLVAGKNRLTAVGEYPPYDAPFGVPFAGLRGDFRVIGDQMTVANPAGSPAFWNDQGYPYYAGDLVYACTFQMEQKRPVGLLLKTPDVAEVFVNGQSAGRRLWEPYRYDLTPFVKIGANKLEIKVTSTLGSLFYRPTPAGLAAAPVLVFQR